MKANANLRLLIKQAKKFKAKANQKGFEVNAVSGWADETNVTVADYHYCHASMNGSYHGAIRTPKVLLSQVQNNIVDWKYIRTYLEWLFNYSPFAPCFISKGARRAIDERVIALDPEQPANLIGGALISTRLGTERYSQDYKIPGRLIMWNRLVELGVHPSLAFTLSHVPSILDIDGDKLNIKKVKTINWKYFELGHEAISPGYHSYSSKNGEITHQNFFNNKQVGVYKESFAKSKNQGGSSILWIGPGKLPEYNVNDVVSKALHAAFDKPDIKSKNPFAAAKNPQPAYSDIAPFEEAMEIIAGLAPSIVKELECEK